MNDTGNGALTLFYSDLDHLGMNDQLYHGWRGQVRCELADASVQALSSLVVQVRFLRPVSFQPWGEWITEKAILRHDRPGLTRLSGPGIRQAMFIETGPDNAHVGVSSTRGGLGAII